MTNNNRDEKSLLKQVDKERQGGETTNKLEWTFFISIVRDEKSDGWEEVRI